MNVQHLKRLGLSLMLCVATSLAASGQSRIAATRAAGFDAFGGFSYANSAYIAPRTDFGGLLGLDYTQYIPRFHGLLNPSLELRGSLASGSAVNERSFSAGVKIGSTWGAFHPYGTFLVGAGVITFSHPSTRPDGSVYASDNSALFLYGGGVVIDGRRNFSALIDLQRQSWDLGGTPPKRFYPVAVTVGVVYHIPFGNHRQP